MRNSKNRVLAMVVLCFAFFCGGVGRADLITVGLGPGGPGGGYDYATIQEGINAAVSGVDTVIVAEGTYYETISFGGKNIILTSTDPDNPSVVAATIIDAVDSGSVVTFSGSESTSCVLTGFTITNGYSTNGGGIRGNNTQATIANCRIINNQANGSYVEGGGLRRCNGTISNCLISGNSATADKDSWGGGLFMCNGDIINCEITNNSTTGEADGGGLFGCNGKIEGCIISNNINGYGGSNFCYGGGLDGCEGIIRNCKISNNTNYGYGAGGLDDCDGGSISNCTIIDNISTGFCGGISVSSSSITNCIMWGNSPGQIYASSQPSYSCIEGGSSGTGNIDDYPLFAGDGYHLLGSSPCIDTGDPAFVPTLGETDIDGEPRVMGGRVDMGADEHMSALAPTIGISPTEFEFYSTYGAANPDTQILTIQNIGAGPLNWEITEDCSWLEVDPNSGESTGDINEVTISVDISGLNCGIYDCNLTILDPLAFNSPQIVPVNLNITGPIIELSSMHFEFTAICGGTAPEDQILTIRNSGSSTLNWNIFEDCDWLSAEPNMGSSTGETDDVTLNADISGLGGGIYNCELLVSDPNAQNNPQTVAVTLWLGDSDSQLHVPSEYSTIQAAIDAASDGDTVIIAEGTYGGTGNKNLDFGGKAITVRSSDPEDPAIVAATIIDCGSSGRGFYFHSGEEANSVVAGLTVRNGRIEGTEEHPDAFGGGIYCSGSSPTILNCSIENCSVYGYDCEGYCGDKMAGAAYGGGICCISGSHPTIVDCVISGNLARSPEVIVGGANAYGGGIFCSSNSTIGVYNSTIVANTARGGKWWSDASSISYACDSYGGGIYIGTNTGSVIKNCVIADNKTVLVVGDEYGILNYGNSEGSGIYCGGNIRVNNCTISGNNTDPYNVLENGGSGGGIYGPATVSDCIIWGNISGSQLTGATSVSYSDVEGVWSGTGNINADPLFVTGPLGDYYLSQTSACQASTSPCVDSGSDTAVNLGMGNSTTRTDHVSEEGVVDMGYHYLNFGFNKPDINADWNVNYIDFAILASQWLQEPGIPSADITPYGGDGIVDTDDLGLLVDFWLECYVSAASRPFPGDNEGGVDPNVVLSWSAGGGAAYHDVYFGTDFDDVNNANILSDEYKGDYDVPSYDPCGLDIETTYYWRIDEKDACGTVKGVIWSFRTNYINSGLVGWWEFEEGDGSIAYDSSGNNNDGLLSAPRPSWVDGKVGEYALDFDGDGDYVEIADDDSLTPGSEITIAFWIYNRGGQKAGIYKYVTCPDVGGSRSYRLALSEDGKAKLWIFSSVSIDDSIEGDEAVPFDEWHHVAGTFNQGNAAIYIDGQLDKSEMLSVTSIMNDAQPLIIGGYWADCNNTFYSNLNGSIDDVRIYDRSLSAGEIEALYQAGL